MAKMKLNDFRSLFDKITDGKILIGIHNDTMIFAFYRSFKDNKVYFYRNIFSSYWVDEDTPFMNSEWEVELSEIKTDIVNYDMFLSWGRRNIITGFKYYYDHPDEECNFFLIKKELERDGGKIVTFDDFKSKDEIGLLIGAASTNEDYYYQYVDSNFKIQNMTCVGGYKVVEDKDIPKNLRKFQKDVITRANVNRIKAAIWKQFLKNAEVFFTPIYLPHLTPDDLTLFKQYSILYLEKK
jgi:hypothetical protein